MKGIGYVNSTKNYYVVNNQNILYVQNNTFRIFDVWLLFKIFNRLKILRKIFFLLFKSADFIYPSNEYNSVGFKFFFIL